MYHTVPTDTAETSDSVLERVFYHTDRVPFVYWEEFSGVKTTVLLVGSVTVLSFVTGLSNLSRPTLTLEGPLAALIPGAFGYVRFAGILLSFVLVVLLIGLERRKRLAWYGTLVVLPLVGLLPLATLQPTEIPVLLLIFVTYPLLIGNRSQFDRRIDLSSLQITALSSGLGVAVYSTVGSYALRDQFVELETWGDSVYYVIVTIATVGYGDITPLTPQARWFSLSVIMLGTGAFTATIGALIVPAIESRMAAAVGKMTPSQLALLEDHVLVLGYSDLTESLLEELEGEVDVVVVTPDSEAASELDERNVNVLADDPTTEEALRDARIGAASGVVVATRDDAQDVLSILAARRTNPDVRIVAAANDRRHLDKLEEVGADDVISPMDIGGRILGRSILTGTATESLFETVKEDGSE